MKAICFFLFLLALAPAYSFTPMTKYSMGSARITDASGKELRVYRVLIKSEQAKNEITNTVTRFENDMKGIFYIDKLERTGKDSAKIVDIETAGPKYTQNVRLLSDGEEFKGFTSAITFPDGTTRNTTITVTSDNNVEKTNVTSEKKDKSGKVLENLRSIAVGIPKEKYEEELKKIKIVGKGR